MKALKLIDSIKNTSIYEPKAIALVGPVGSGKTMLTRRIRGALPMIDRHSFLYSERERIFQASGLEAFGLEADLSAIPLRAPHHTCSTIGLIGGGSPARPGEVSLAHGGVLFLDEMMEFRRDSLQALGEVLITGESILKWKSEGSWHEIGYPSVPSCLVAAFNPCPCGYAWSEYEYACTCSAERVADYWMRATDYMQLLGIQAIHRMQMSQQEKEKLARLPV